MKNTKTVDEYISGNGQWQKTLEELRQIMLFTGLSESVKWGVPVYTFQGKNIVGIAAFKSYVGIWFYQGVFLKDTKKVLVNAQEGKTKALRQWRFTENDKLDKTLIKAYVLEAIDNQKAGKELKPSKTKTMELPPELQSSLNSNAVLKERFQRLSPACRREYAEYIAEAIREDTKQRRIDKIVPMIMDLAGLNDKYKR